MEREAIGHAACHCCGKRVTVRLNKNRIAYYYCPHVADDGELCSGHAKWGRAVSNTMIAAHARASRLNPKAPPHEDVRAPGAGELAGVAAAPARRARLLGAAVVG